MTKARNIADLLDANGDVKTASLDNVPASDNASALTSGTLAIARLADGSITPAKLHNDAKVVKSGSAPSNPVEGNLWYDTTNKILKVYDATSSAFVKIVKVTPTLDSISGAIVDAIATNLTLTGTGFLSANLIVAFTPSGGSASNVTVTPASDTSAVVAVPSAIYGQSVGTSIVIKVTNSDGKNSDTKNLTVAADASGGTVVTSGGYKYHTFTSSGNFVLQASKNIEYIMVAGGGSSGSYAGGGGAGGMLAGSVSNLSPNTYAVVVGAGGVHTGTDSNNSSDNGDDTTFNSLTAIGGGRGATGGVNGFDGGSGGGSSYGDSGTKSGGNGTAGQGNNGGGASYSNPYPSGGGGGKGAAGGNASSSTQAGSGGAGINTYSAWATATSTGNSGYYAGGGGGGIAGGQGYTGGGNGGSGGAGGGGAGGVAGSGQTAGQANTGGGGGGGAYNGSNNTYYPTNGGSGIVIIRYSA